MAVPPELDSCSLAVALLHAVQRAAHSLASKSYIVVHLSCYTCEFCLTVRLVLVFYDARSKSGRQLVAVCRGLPNKAAVL